MRLREWQAEENLAAYVRELMSDPRFQGLLSMLEEEHPRHYQPAVGVEMSSESHILTLGRVYGYDLCINTLRGAAAYTPEQIPLEATFEPEPPETSEK